MTLALALISKPSLVFLLFLVVIVTTKLYKNILAFMMLLFAIIASAIQILLFSGAGSALKLGNVTGFIKMAITFIQSVGASLLFNFMGYIARFQNQTLLMVLSCLCGGIIIVVLLLRIVRERTYNAVIGTITILVALGCANLPYMMIDYNSDITSVLYANITSCFSKYKLQYQLTSGVISLMIFVYCINYLYNDIKHFDASVLFGIKTVCIILALNGFLSGLYHGTDITVQGLDSEIVSYDTVSHYMYCPYPDWDYLWTSSSCGGWINGNRLVKYLDKPLEEGGAFQNYNNEWENLVVENDEAVIYLLLSEKKMDRAGVPCWINYFDSSNAKKEYIIGDNLSVTFSKISENGIRYAVIPYTEDTINTLKSDNVFITQEDAALDVARLNCILVW